MIYSMTLKSESEILSELREGDQNRATTAFIRQYQNFVFNTAFRYLNSVEDAEDISQEVFIKAIESINNFRGESSIKTWLYRITANYCLNYIRRQKIRKIFRFMPDPNDEANENIFKDSSALPDINIQNEELQKSFFNAINKLPKKQRETFALRYFEDLPYNEISEILGTSVGGLKANYFQAVKKLAVELKEFRDLKS